MKKLRELYPKFKPNLFPNDKPGIFVDWEDRLHEHKGPVIVSIKHDGIHTLITEEGAFSRELKKLPSVHLQHAAKQVWKYYSNIIPDLLCIQAEFIVTGCNLEEIKHFARSEDVMLPSTRRKYELLWKKTNQGTSTYPAQSKGVIIQKSWPFPGRDLNWVTNSHIELYDFKIFDMLSPELLKDSKIERYLKYTHYFILHNEDADLSPIKTPYSSIISHTLHSKDIYSNVTKYFEKCVEDGFEGLMIQKPDAKYKFGRYTTKSELGFKMKPYEQLSAVVLDVTEGTEALDGTERTIDNFGRSKTSQKQEDRQPSGRIDSLKVRMDDGRVFDVMLRGFNHSDRRELKVNPEKIVGKTIKFHAMAPTKQGGMPRHAVYQKETYV